MKPVDARSATMHFYSLVRTPLSSQPAQAGFAATRHSGAV
ncbi:MAG: hypothetical protein OJF49_002960 [Ktedonobacterales bacterium]|nr:MAG: hypothetical protein OJF49_002960 [Ktedonobacterales bacterium]